MVLISMVRKFQVEHGAGLTIDRNAGFGQGALAGQRRRGSSRACWLAGGRA